MIEGGGSMSETMIWILAIVGLTLFILVARYVISAVVNKGADAIRNAIVDKKNAQESRGSENLADRFRK